MDFTDLPPEIRLQVYACAFPSADILICLTDAYEYPPRYALRHRLGTVDAALGRRPATALLLTSKDIHREVESMVYSRPNFHYESPRALKTFLDRISSNATRAIQTLSLRRTFAKPHQVSYEDMPPSLEMEWVPLYQRLAKDLKSK
jgi:hypothetical protein